MSDETVIRYLHGERPDGGHLWAPFTDVEHLLRQINRLCPNVPADLVWDVTETTYPPPRPEETP